MLPVQSAPASGRRLITIAQLIVSLLGVVFSLVSAGGLVLVGLVGLISETTAASDATSVLATAWISLLVAILAVPSLVYSIQALQQRTFALPRINGFRLSTILLLVWPLVLLLGNLVSEADTVAWLLLPPLALLAVALPVWWLVEFARRKIYSGSPQRQWGLVSFSMLITMPVLLFVEVIMLLVLVVLFAVWVSTQPELLNMLENMAQRLTIGQPDPEAILALLSPYLQNPLVIFSILAVVAGLVPLVEELLKPLALWALAGRRLSPGEGFVAGAIAGGIFALLESLFYLSSPLGDSWAALAAGRAATGLLHTTTTALVGWALAAAWQNGSYLRLGAMYLLASAMHGLWNAFSILNGLAAARSDDSSAAPFLDSFTVISPYALGGLVVVFILLLWWGNRSIRQSHPFVETAPAEHTLPVE